MATFGEINRTAVSPLGIITEANPLNFPEGASLDEKNFVLNRDGSRQRRLGLDYSLTPNLPFSASSTELEVHMWNNAGEKADKDYAVVRTGPLLYIHDLNDAALPVVKILGIASAGEGELDTTVVSGDFIFTSGSDRVFVVSGKDLTVSSFVIKARDVWGIDDELKVDQRPISLSNAHAYNLANQGWESRAADYMRTGDGPDRYPSNADVYNIGAGVQDQEFLEEVYLSSPFGNTPSAKGSAIIDPLNPVLGREAHAADRGFATEASLYNDRTTQGATIVETYGGRAFYAGFGGATKRVNSTYPDLNSFIFFSKTYDNLEDLSKCHQESDPAGQDSSIVDTDGGFISIPAVGKIFKMVSTGKSLLVFSSAGVWEVSSADAIFTPTSYQVRKVTNIGAINKGSIVEAADAVLYWSKYGIHAVSISDVDQYYVSQNMIEQTIQTLYDSIGAAARKSSEGFFDTRNNKLRWAYSSTGGYVKDRELIYDVALKAWYRNEIGVSSDGSGVVNYIALPERIAAEVTADVVSGADDVLSGTDDVKVPTTVISTEDREHVYLVHKESGDNYGMASFSNTNFQDWNEVDAYAELITGYITGDSAAKRKSASYLTTHMNRTEQGIQLFAAEDIIPGESTIYNDSVKAVVDSDNLSYEGVNFLDSSYSILSGEEDFIINDDVKEDNLTRAMILSEGGLYLWDGYALYNRFTEQVIFDVRTKYPSTPFKASWYNSGFIGDRFYFHNNDRFGVVDTLGNVKLDLDLADTRDYVSVTPDGKYVLVQEWKADLVTIYSVDNGTVLRSIQNDYSIMRNDSLRDSTLDFLISKSGEKIVVRQTTGGVLDDVIINIGTGSQEDVVGISSMLSQLESGRDTAEYLHVAGWVDDQKILYHSRSTNLVGAEPFRIFLADLGAFGLSLEVYQSPANDIKEGVFYGRSGGYSFLLIGTTNSTDRVIVIPEGSPDTPDFVIDVGNWSEFHQIKSAPTNKVNNVDCVYTHDQVIYFPVSDETLVIDTVAGTHQIVAECYFPINYNGVVHVRNTDNVKDLSSGTITALQLTSVGDLVWNYGHPDNPQSASNFVDDSVDQTGVLITNPSSCKLQAQWDWTDNAVAGKWGKEIQVYRHKRFWMPEFTGDQADWEDGYPVVTTKNRLRGSGKALSLKFRTEPLKDCQLLGWNLALQQHDKM